MTLFQTFLFLIWYLWHFVEHNEFKLSLSNRFCKYNFCKKGTCHRGSARRGTPAVPFNTLRCMKIWPLGVGKVQFCHSRCTFQWYCPSDKLKVQILHIFESVAVIISCLSFYFTGSLFLYNHLNSNLSKVYLSDLC